MTQKKPKPKHESMDAYIRRKYREHGQKVDERKRRRKRQGA